MQGIALISLAVWASVLSFSLAALPTRPDLPSRPDSGLPSFTRADETQCYTTQSPTRAPTRPSTYWSTWTTSCIATSTAIVITTTTPAPVTSTVTTTVITTTVLSTSTSTFTSTSTIISTIESSTTTTITSTATSTVSTDTTSTVPTSAPFEPVQTSLPGSTQMKKRGTSPSPRVKRGILDGQTAEENLYPHDVSCYVYRGECSTAITTKTITFTAPTPTSVKTSTSTLTSTSAPSASTTTTTTVTNTVTSISTVTNSASTTITTTVVTSTSLVYEACATNDMANYADGVGISGLHFPSNWILRLKPAGDNSNYECCVAAIQDPVAALWIRRYEDDPLCWVVENPTCTGPEISSETAQVQVSHLGSPPVYMVGNAYCGQWNDVFVY